MTKTLSVGAGAAVAVAAVFALSAVPVLAGHMSPVIIDGVVNSGAGEEWDGHFLGTSVTGFGGGMAVDVWGFISDGFLYVAYRADTTQPGWATACALNINGNFYFKTPDSAAWPEAGYTILEMVYPRVMQTDGSDWSDMGTLAGNGVEAGYTEMFSTDDTACADGTGGNHEAEFKIPLSLLSYAGDDGQIKIFGQYWQYDSSEPFFVDIPSPPPPAVANSSSIVVSVINRGTIDNDTSAKSYTGDNTALGSVGGRGGRGGEVEAGAGSFNNGGAMTGNGGNGGSAGAGGLVGTGNASADAGTINDLNGTDVEVSAPSSMNSSAIGLTVDNNSGLEKCGCTLNNITNTTRAKARTGTNEALGSAGGDGSDAGDVENEGTGDFNNGGATTGGGGTGGAGNLGGMITTGNTDSSAGTENRLNTTTLRIR